MELVFHLVLARLTHGYIQDIVDMYGLEYYWWYWPAATVLFIACVLLKYRRHRRGFHEVLDELSPDPPHRDSRL